MLDFSIVIPVRNRPEEIRRCVASCYASRFPAAQYEVIVVDNGSTDDTARAAMQSGARVVSEPEANRCRARNLGAHVARGRWLAFTDSDCEVDPDWLGELLRGEDELGGSGTVDRIGAMAGAVDSSEPKNEIEAYISARRWIDQRKFLAGSGRFSPPFAATANLAIRADVFREVGGFDPDLSLAGEDADWCWRAAAAGWKVHYIAAAKVVHYHRSSRREMMRQAYQYGVGNAQLFAKHRAKRGQRAWIEPRRYSWALKGLLKTPYALLQSGRAADRWFAWYDFLSNSAQAAGRLRGAVKYRIPIL